MLHPNFIFVETKPCHTYYAEYNISDIETIFSKLTIKNSEFLGKELNMYVKLNETMYGMFSTIGNYLMFCLKSLYLTYTAYVIVLITICKQCILV